MPPTALVINPWVTDFKLYDEWMHPIGLYFLISLLTHKGFEVRYFNCLQRPRSSRQKYGNTGDFEHREFPKPQQYRALKRKYKLYGQSREALESFLSGIPRRPDVICMGSGMTYWLPGLVETARIVNLHFPACVMVVGGISAKLIPLALKKALPDAYVFQGSLFDPDSLRQSGIPFISDLKSTLLKPSFLDAYQHVTFLHHGPILSSLGCPLSCSYCASRILQKTFFIRDSDVVTSEIEYLCSRFNVRHFAVFDDALLHAPDKNFIPLMRSIDRRGIKASFHTPNGLHANSITPEIVTLLAQSGFRTLRLGYETGDAHYYGDGAAKVQRGDLAKKTSMLFANGFSNASVGVYVMAGLINQSPTDVLQEIDFVASLSVKVKPVFLSPVPGTRTFEHYLREFPEMNDDPLLHNDTYFMTRLPGWDADAMQRILDSANKHNARLDTTF